ncbi:acetyl-CoA acetyltransferase [Rhodococcoides fascians A21d2]|uniref:acetyl-CoA acetyltransferase n=1 Tax=Rhodococcoides fascians TaxID=1828 RepID=UPI00056059A7|nr:acetyl-CoA acetyltransferase [Rhodococcus fascians]QIH99792.1 acetyl-CoA acetyltransferase [Rhodococcus fascians A21d2]
MTDPSTVPVIIGVADVRSGRFGDPAPPKEPVELISEAAARALRDSGNPDFGARVDAIYAVRTSSWSYDDLPMLLAQRIGAPAPRTWTSSVGGHWPAALLDRIGSDIADRKTTVALLVGGETQASVTGLMKQGVDPRARGWSTEPGGPPTFSADDLGSPNMIRAGVVTPVRVYPLFENRFSHDIGHNPEQSRVYSARLYSEFSSIAVTHPCAWSPTFRTSDELAVAGPKNRPISDAYPLMMNAMPFVDQAAAVLVCSLAVARELGVDEDRIVYLWGGAGASEPEDVLARNDFGTSAAMKSAVHRTLDRAQLTGGDLGLIDAYSPFPIVPKNLVETLGVPRTTVPTVLGGHSFFGGPLNSYSLHAVAEVTRSLRRTLDDRPALVHANGGYMTTQHSVVLSRHPHPDGYVGDPVAQSVPSTRAEIVHEYSGTAEIVTATVEFDRAGEPSTGIVIATTPAGSRVAGHTDAGDAAAMIRHTHDGTRSLVGAHVTITDRDGCVTVTFEDEEPT